MHTDPGQASPRFVQAATVAGFAEVLKHSFWANGISLQDVARAASTRLGNSDDPASCGAGDADAASGQPRGDGAPWCVTKAVDEGAHGDATGEQQLGDVATGLAL